jgi:hypothetical protein
MSDRGSSRTGNSLFRTARYAGAESLMRVSLISSIVPVT